MEPSRPKNKVEWKRWRSQNWEFTTGDQIWRIGRRMTTMMMMIHFMRQSLALSCACNSVTFLCILCSIFCLSIYLPVRPFGRVWSSPGGLNKWLKWDSNSYETELFCDGSLVRSFARTTITTIVHGSILGFLHLTCASRLHVQVRHDVMHVGMSRQSDVSAIDRS